MNGDDGRCTGRGSAWDSLKSGALGTQRWTSWNQDGLHDGQLQLEYVVAGELQESRMGGNFVWAA